MSRDLIPTVMGCGCGLGITAAVAVTPGSNLTVGGIAGVVAGLLVAVAFSLLRVGLRLEEPDPDVDDGSGERRVWETRDMQRLSPFDSWANGNSVLPGIDDTREMPKPKLNDSTQVMRADDVYGYNPRHGAGAR